MCGYYQASLNRREKVTGFGMRLLIIRGNVLGGHLIADMGLEVPYQQDVQVPYDRAQWSRDLMHAIERGMVTKVAITALTPQPPVMPRVETAPKIAPPQPPAGVSAPGTHTMPVRAPSNPQQGEMQALQEMNAQLLGKLEAMVDSQTALMGKIAEMLALSRLPQPDQRQTPLPRGGANTSNDTDSGEETVVFIPTTIRPDGMRVVEGTGTGTEISKSGGVSSSSLGDAAGMLAKMKGKKKAKK